MKRLRQGLYAFALTSALLLVSACGGGSGSSADAGTAPPVLTGPLGDPASQTVGSAGGTLRATTLGASVQVDIPAGALAADTVIRLTPLTPASGDWVSFKLEPGGVFFARPVTLTLTLPVGTVPDATASLKQVQDSGNAFVTTRVDRTARTLTATLSTFGGNTLLPAGAAGSVADNRAFALRARTRTDPLPDSGTLSAQQVVGISERVAEARRRIERLQAHGFFEDAFWFQLDIADLLQRTGEDGYTAQAVPFLIDAHTNACIERSAAIAASATAPIAAAGDFKPLAQKILFWEAAAQRLGGEPCTGTTADAAVQALVARELAFVQRQLATAPASGQFGAPANEVKDARRVVAETRQLQATAPAASAAAQGAGRSHTAEARMRPLALALTTLADVVQRELIDPEVTASRQAAWSAARDRGVLLQYEALLGAFGPTPVLQQDVQYVRTRIQVTSSDAQGSSIDSATLGFATVPSEPADPVQSATLRVRPGGSLVLSGNVATLECASQGAETLIVTFEDVTVASISGSGGTLLAGALASLNPADLLAAAGLPTDDTGRHPLRIKRNTPCATALGLDDAPLATVTLDFNNLCSPAGSDAFCITPIEAAELATSNHTFLGLNARGEVLVRIDGSYACGSTYDTETLEPCGAVWRKGVLRMLPNRFVPTGLADDGSVAGEQLAGVLSSRAATQTYTDTATVLPQGRAPGIALAAANSHSVLTVSAAGRVILFDYPRPYVAAFYASSPPAWGASSLLHEDDVRTGPSFGIFQDGDAAGIVGGLRFLPSNTVYAMKDFIQGAAGGETLAVDSRGTLLVRTVDPPYRISLSPESSNLPATWQPYSLGRNGDVLACAAPAADGTRQVRLVNLYSGAIRATVPGTLTLTTDGVAYTAEMQSLCDFGTVPTPTRIDDKGRVLVIARSDTRPNVTAAILTPRGVALP